MQRTKSIAWQCTTDVQLRPDAILCKSIPRVPINPPPTPGQTLAFDIYTYPHSRVFDILHKGLKGGSSYARMLLTK